MYKRTPTLNHHEFMNKTMLVIHSDEIGAITANFKLGRSMDTIAAELRHMADQIDNKTEEYKNGPY